MASAATGCVEQFKSFEAADEAAHPRRERLERPGVAKEPAEIVAARRRETVPRKRRQRLAPIRQDGELRLREAEPQPRQPGGRGVAADARPQGDQMPAAHRRRTDRRVDQPGGLRELLSAAGVSR